MKRIALLVFSMAVAAIAVSCTDDETTPMDTELAGVNIAVGESDGTHTKLFILNEGAYQKNNASLDFFRFSEGNYYSNAFGIINPTVAQGLGDIGNDIALNRGLLWIVMNGSCVLHVVDAYDENLIASIPITDPRFIAFDDSYAYVSSYAGAVYGGKEVKGKVYRISLDTFLVDAEVEVGCQPEGLAVYGRKLYVANSGGFNSVHENTVSVIDLNNFKVVSTIPVASNLRFLACDAQGGVWVSSYGESTYTQDNLGNWVYVMTEPMSLYQIVGTDVMPVEGVHVSCMTLCKDGNIYAIGNSQEMSEGTSYTLYTISTTEGSVRSVQLSGTQASAVGNPYGIQVNPVNGDIYIADASYVAPGKVFCFTKDLKAKWSTTAGMLPAHMVLF